MDRLGRGDAKEPRKAVLHSVIAPVDQVFMGAILTSVILLLVAVSQGGHTIVPYKDGKRAEGKVFQTTKEYVILETDLGMLQIKKSLIRSLPNPSETNTNLFAPAQGNPNSNACVRR